jgi:hypothetical protein
MNSDFNVVEDALLQFSQIDICPSTSACSVTFVIRVSKRHADAFASRPDILTRAGLMTKLGRDFRPGNPICDNLGEWQQMALSAPPHGTESIIFQGTIEPVKEVRNKHPMFSESIFSSDTPRTHGTNHFCRRTICLWQLPF